MARYQRLGELGIATTPGGLRLPRQQPASLRSFIITEDLGDIVCSELLPRGCRTRRKLPSRRLLRAVADVACGILSLPQPPRFYICHLCMNGDRLAAGTSTSI